jgi:signal transduction histidine kinase
VPAYTSYAADIHSSGTRLLNTLTGTLDIARIDGGSHRLDEEEELVALGETNTR